MQTEKNDIAQRNETRRNYDEGPAIEERWYCGKVCGFACGDPGD